MSRLLLILFALTLSACATVAPERAATDDRPLVILVGIDGFRPDYLDRGATPTLDGLRGRGRLRRHAALVSQRDLSQPLHPGDRPASGPPRHRQQHHGGR